MAKSVAIGAFQLVFLAATMPMSHASEAGPLRVTIAVTGTAFEGAPNLELRADGSPVGDATLADPASANQTFSFEVRDSSSVEQLSVAFTNDHFEAGAKDRNLFIQSVSINGVLYDGSSLATSEGTVAETDGRTLRLFSNGEAILTKPVAGWPPSDKIASDVPASVAEATTAAPSAEVAEAPAEIAAIAEQDQPSQSKCIGGEITITGFATNETTISAEEQNSIVEFLRKAGKDCTFEIVGYASMSGPKNVNVSLSEARARAVKTALTKLGIPEGTVTASGAGPTQVFGAGVENRRVVIKATPPA